MMERGVGKGRGRPAQTRSQQKGQTSLNLALRNANNNNRKVASTATPEAKKGTIAPRSTARSILPMDKKGELVQGTHKTAVGTVTVRKIEPAKEYNVLSVARAMNPDLGKGVQDLFELELDAAKIAIETGLYISWRPKLPPYDRQDCQRVDPSSRCFCGHRLYEHAKFTGIERKLKCEDLGCPCQGFNFVPSRPEEVGEFWLRRRRNFDPVAYRCTCRCKHTHEEHDPKSTRCKVRACGCSIFSSASVCAACDQHTEVHETVLETERERADTGRPIGSDWLPFSEIPTLKKMVLTGVDDGGPMAPDPASVKAPEERPAINSSTPFPKPRGR